MVAYQYWIRLPSRLALIGLAAAAHQGWSANIFTMTSDMFPRRAVGSVVGAGAVTLAEAFKNIRLNLLMSITAVTTTFICILVFGVGLLVSEHVEGVIGSVREDVSVEAFMPNATSQEVDALAAHQPRDAFTADLDTAAAQLPPRLADGGQRQGRTT